jgi:hypothetical protein
VWVVAGAVLVFGGLIAGSRVAAVVGVGVAGVTILRYARWFWRHRHQLRRP